MTLVYRSALLFLLALGWVLPSAARTRKGDRLLRQAEEAEYRQDFEAAFALSEQALQTDYGDPAYQLRVRKTRFLASQARLDKGLKLRKEGKLEEALLEFQKAFTLDPASSQAEAEAKRTYEMIQRNKGESQLVKPEDRGLTPAQIARRELEEKMASLRSTPELKPLSPLPANLKISNQPVKNLFETVAKLAGLNVIFDPDFLSQSGNRAFTLDVNNSTIEEALDYISLLTKAYWKPISANTIFVTQDQVTKRRDFEDNVVKVFYLQNVTAPQELNEIAAAVRAVTEIRRLLTYTAQMAIMARGTADQIALAQKLIYDLDKPRPEVVIDVIVLEANRTRTRNLAATITSGGAGGINLPISYTGGAGATTGTGTGTGPGGTINLGRVANLSTGDFSVAVPGALVQALLNDRTTRVIQNPQVRTLDTVKATLKIGDRFPYATGSFQPGVGGVGINPLVSTQFQFAEVGVNIDITPKIHNDGEVSMHLEVEVSNIRDQIDVGGLRQPVIGQRKIIEDVRLRQGEVSLLGGLSSLVNSRASVGLPGLANAPGLGWLFGTQSSDINRSELLIVMTPRIVRSPDLNDVNLRTIAAGNEQVVRLSYEPKREPAEPAAPAAVPAPAVPSPAKPEPALGATPPDAAPPPGGGMALRFAPGNITVPLSSPVNVAIEGINFVDIASVPFRVQYDPKVLRLVEVNRGPMMSSDGQPVSFTRDVTNGAIKIARLAGAGGVSGSAPIVILTFQAIGKGETRVSIEEAQVQDAQQQPVRVETTPALVTVL